MTSLRTWRATPWILALVVGATLPVASARAQQAPRRADATAADDEENGAAAPDGSRADEARRRVLASALVLRVPAATVLDLDDAELAYAFDELEEIQEQRTAAQVIGVIGGVLMAVGIALGATANFLFDEGVIRGLTGWAVCGTGGILALVAAVFQIDVPFRWQRWAASLGAR